MNLSTAKGLARSGTGLPIALLSTRDKRETRHTLLTETRAVQRIDSASIVASSLPSSHLLASLAHSYPLPFTVLSASCTCKDAVLCSPVLLPEDRLGNCTMESDSVPVKQFDGFQRLKREGDRFA